MRREVDPEAQFERAESARDEARLARASAVLLPPPDSSLPGRYVLLVNEGPHAGVQLVLPAKPGSLDSLVGTKHVARFDATGLSSPTWLNDPSAPRGRPLFGSIPDADYP